jgi:hypothetical protein
MVRFILALLGTRKKKPPGHNIGLATTNLATKVQALVTALADYANQTRTSLSWPCPSPKGPLLIWLRGEADARATKVTP